MVGEFFGEGFRFHFGFWNRAEDAVPVSGGDHVDRNSMVKGEGLFQGFVAVSVHEDDLVRRNKGSLHNPVGGGGSVGDKEGHVGTKDLCGVLFGGPDGA